MEAYVSHPINANVKKVLKEKIVKKVNCLIAFVNFFSNYI